MVFSKILKQLAFSAICLLFFAGPAIAEPATDPATDQFYTANELYNRKLYTVAIKEYRAFLAKHPTHPKAEEARLGLALCHYCTDAYKQAEPLLSSLIQNGKAGNKDQLGLLRGQCLMKLARPSEAQSAFSAVASSGSAGKHRIPALAGLCEVLFQQEKWGETVKAADNLSKAKPPPEYLKRGLYQGAYANYQLKNFGQATPALERLVILMKDEPMLHQITFFLGECYRQTEKPLQAAEQYAKAAEGLKGLPAAEAYYRLGFVNFGQKKYDEAISAFEQSLKKKSHAAFSDEATLFLGRAWLEKKNYQKATHYLQPLSAKTSSPTAKKRRLHKKGKAQGQAIEPSVEASLWHARVHSRQNNHAVAAAMLKQAISRFGNSPLVPDLASDCANALMALGKFEEASQSLDKVLRAKDWPQMNDAIRLYSICRHRVKDYSKSLKYADDFLSRYKGDKMAAEVMFVRAENLYLLNRLNEAAAAYRAYLAAHPKHHNVDPATFRIAQVLNTQSKWAEALKMAEPLVTKKPKEKLFSQLNFLLGSCSFRLGKWDAAIKHLETFFLAYKNDKHEPNVDSALIQLAIAKINKTDAKKAFEYLNILISQYPKSPHRSHALSEMGRLQYESGDHKAAYQTLTGFLRTHGKAPQRANVEYYLGWTALALDKVSEAEQHFGAVVSAFPKDPLAADAALQRGLAQLAQEKYKDASASLSQMVRQYAHHPRMDLAVFSLGVAFARQNNWQNASPQFNKVVGSYPKSEVADRALYELAWCEKGLNRNAEAVKHYDRLLKDYPQSTLKMKAQTELTELTFDADKLGEAIEQLRHTLAELQDEKLKEQTLYRLGTAYFRKRDFEEAAQTLETFIQKYPMSAMLRSARFQAGESRLKLKETVAARDHFRHAAKTDKTKSRPELLESALMRLGETQGLTKQWNESAQTYAQFLKQFPKSRWTNRARFGMAWAFEKQKNFSAAMQQYKTLVSTNGKDELCARAQFQIGECMFAMKKYDQAIQELVRVGVKYRYKDWDAKATLEIARALEAKDDKERAIEQFKEVISKFPGHDAAVVAKQRLDILRRGL